MAVFCTQGHGWKHMVVTASGELACGACLSQPVVEEAAQANVPAKKPRRYFARNGGSADDCEPRPTAEIIALFKAAHEAGTLDELLMARWVEACNAA